jgi:ribonuclease BN (tRNA processing enzyme)
MKIIFLGTNGWYDTSTGNTSCVLIESEDYYIIFDAGNGFYKLDRYLKKDEPVFLFLSHFHLDHISGLHILDKFSFKKGLRIYGPKGTRDILKIIANKPFTLPLSDLAFKVDVLELPKHKEKLPFRIECMDLLHSSSTLGYRLSLEGKVIVYCPDTGYCDNAVKLAQGADLLIAECSLKSAEYDIKWPHLNPQYASRIAKEAEVGQLVLFHFDASRYPTMDSRKEAEIEAKKTFPNSIASKDDMQIQIQTSLSRK